MGCRGSQQREERTQVTCYVGNCTSDIFVSVEKVRLIVCLVEI